MSNCKYTELVTPNTCLGDSLATFNDNFSKLDNAVCQQPVIFPGNGTKVNQFYTEQNINAVAISTNPSTIYNTSFESLQNGTVATEISLGDGMGIKATTFPTPQPSTSNPSATFSAVSNSKSSPNVTVYWTAPGNDYTTVYALNSGTLVTTDLGTIGFNGPITTFLSAGELMYVAGAFTQVGGYDFKKLCVIDLNKGTDSSYIDGTYYTEINLGLRGQVVESPIYDTQLAAYGPHPLLTNGGFGLEGEIRCLAQSGDLLIVGGTYKNVPGKNLGRGLTIWNSRTKRIYPFYVNGDVNVVHVESNELYVGGTFNFINYGPIGASEISGLRVRANGLAKISLSLIDSFANKSIIQVFSDNVISAFSTTATINSITSSPATGALYIGGEFKCHKEGKLIASSLAIISPEGLFSDTWQPIIEGVVHKLLINENTLYVAGSIPYYLTSMDLETTPRPFNQFYNLICFDIQTPYYPILVPSWRPKANGPVFNIAIHNGNDGTKYLYCQGHFDQLNGVNVSFLGAVPRNAGTVNNINEAQTGINWRIHLDKPPQPSTKALFRLENSILVGGSFNYINSRQRRYLGRVNGPLEELLVVSPPRVVWSLGAQLVGTGGPILFNSTNFISVSSSCTEYGNLNKTTFPAEFTKSIFEGYKEGSLMRFYLRREYDSRTGALSADAYVTGWKIDFDNN